MSVGPYPRNGLFTVKQNSPQRACEKAGYDALFILNSMALTTRQQEVPRFYPPHGATAWRGSDDP